MEPDAGAPERAGEAAMAAGDPRTLFLGRWTILRNIFDVDSNWQGRFDGWAEFTPSGDGLDYAEEGELRFAGLMAMKATRRYRWAFPGGNRVSVFFDDGRAFHEFRLGQGRAEASHYCDPDLYEFEVSEKSRSLFGQFLFAYKINPQTAFYLGYDNTYVGNEDYSQVEAARTFFLKIGYAWVP